MSLLSKRQTELEIFTEKIDSFFVKCPEFCSFFWRTLWLLTLTVMAPIGTSLDGLDPRVCRR